MVFAVISFRVDEEFISFFIKTTGYAVSRKGDIVEISFYGRIIGSQHRHIMMRLFPFFKFGDMAFFAGLVPHKSFVIGFNQGIFCIFGAATIYNENPEKNKQYHQKEYQYR